MRISPILLTLIIFFQIFLAVDTVYGYRVLMPTPEQTPWMPTPWIKIIESNDGSISVAIPNIPPIQFPRVKPPEIMLLPPPLQTLDTGSTVHEDITAESEGENGGEGEGECNPADPTTWGACIIEAVWSAIESIINTIRDTILGVFETMRDAVLGAVQTFAQWIVNTASGIANGIMLFFETVINMPTQFLNGYWELTIGSLVDLLSPLGWARPIAAPLCYTALILETIPVVIALGYLGKYIVLGIKTVITAVI